MVNALGLFEQTSVSVKEKEKNSRELPYDIISMAREIIKFTLPTKSVLKIFFLRTFHENIPTQKKGAPTLSHTKFTAFDYR